MSLVEDLILAGGCSLWFKLSIEFKTTGHCKILILGPTITSVLFQMYVFEVTMLLKDPYSQVITSTQIKYFLSIEEANKRAILVHIINRFPLSFYIIPIYLYIYIISFCSNPVLPLLYCNTLKSKDHHISQELLKLWQEVGQTLTKIIVKPNSEHILKRLK